MLAVALVVAACAAPGPSGPLVVIDNFTDLPIVVTVALTKRDGTQ